ITRNSCNRWGLPISWIFAIVADAELTRDSFISPDFLACSFRILGEVIISFRNVPVHGTLCSLHGRKVAIVNHGLGHSTEYGLDHVQELRTGWKRNKFYSWMSNAVYVDILNAHV